MPHIAWSEIDNFHNLRRSLNKYPDLVDNKTDIYYRAKVKLHGTNAAVRIESNGNIVAQSRTSDLVDGNDNAGFAQWVKIHSKFWANLVNTTYQTTIFGEWVGPGIQKGVAVSKIPTKSFVVFAAIINGKSEEFITDPEILKEKVKDIPGVYVLPWTKEEVKINWTMSSEDLQPVLNKINGWVSEIETCDWWVKEVFGIEGVGEGLVFYPKNTDYKNFGNLCFKAKGEKHNTVANTKPAQADPTIASNIDAFADMVLTEARLLQGAQATTLDYSLKDIGKFIKWIQDDLMKEIQAEFEASKLDFKAVAKSCSNKARIWFLAQSKLI